jgi:IclR family transcriptional regulator, acetate operon repressor
VESQQPARTRDDEPGIRSIERALRLIAVAAESPDGIGLADASRAADLAPSTATRILRTLEASGFVARRPDGGYVAGGELIRLGALHIAESPLYMAAQARLDAMAAETGESCYLAVPVDDEWATYVRMAPSSRAVRHVSWLGRRIPRATSATGAALSGNLGSSRVAVVAGGVEPDTTAVAAPVYDRGRIVAAVNIVAPSFRMSPSTIDDITNVAVAAASALSRDGRV